MTIETNKIQYLVADTNAFIKNLPLQDLAENVYTTQDVVEEITNKRQLRRLAVLPFDLKVKDVFPENINFVTEFSKKTGDYASLSSTDLKVIALTYQLEKELVGDTHLKTEPVHSKTTNVSVKHIPKEAINETLPGFYNPDKNKSKECEEVEDEDKCEEENENDCSNDVNKDEEEHVDDSVDILEKVCSDEESSYESDGSEDDDEGWITPHNIKDKERQMNASIVEEKPSVVACMTGDFAMQNVLKQIGLSVSNYDGRIIRQIRTYIFRCYACFKTTSVMTKVFCPKCGNKTLKRVSVTVDENGKQIVHINGRRPLTGRGKKYSLPQPKGGKHSKNPILFEDQPLPDQRPTRLAKTKTDPLNPDYIAGYSPFVMRDITSKSAMLGVTTRGNKGVSLKHWMQKNPNEARRRRK